MEVSYSGKGCGMRRLFSVLLVLLVGVTLVPSAAVQGATSYGNKAVEGRWFRDEYRQVNYWGPLSTAKNGQQEPYDGAMRLVQYFDKGRIEAKDDVYTTSGLLVVEMMTGQVQMGDATFMQQRPAEITAVGDAAADSPTYADLARTGKRQVKGEPVSMYEWERLERRWRASAIKGSYMFPYVEDPAQRYGQAVLPQFEAFALKIGASVPDVLGYPLTPPLIVYAPVAGRNEQLYIQAFERRVLTYNPSNPKEYEVEFGNIGQHYYSWRYSGGNTAAIAPVAAVPGTTVPVATTAPASTLAVAFTNVTSPVQRGLPATASVQTAAGANCSIVVTYATTISMAQGLDPKTAGSDGAVTWTWLVGGNTTPDTWPIKVTCSAGGQSTTASTTFTVTAKS